MSQTIEIVDLHLEGDTQTRAGDIHQPTVDTYSTKVDDLPPIDVFHDGETYWVADGFHRISAVLQAGGYEIEARVREGGRREAILFGVSANVAHGLALTNADKRRAVGLLLADTEWSQLSDREIARRTGSTHPFVGKVRRELNGGADEPETVTTPNVPTPTNPVSAETHRAASPGELDGDRERSQGGDTEYQAPQPDNTVRTPVEREHTGKELDEGNKAGICAFARDGWPLDKIAERFRVPRWQVEEVVNEGVPDEAEGKRSSLLSQWFTPPELVDFVTLLAALQPGLTVLEPSAGDGALVAPALKAGCRVTAIDIDRRRVDTLIDRFGAEHEIFCEDYLDDGFEWTAAGERFDLGLLNPPYEGGLDGAFVQRALADCKRVIAILRFNAIVGLKRWEQVWSQDRCSDVYSLVSRPNFDEGGNGAKSDFCVAVFAQGAVEHTRLHWVTRDQLAGLKP